MISFVVKEGKVFGSLRVNLRLLEICHLIICVQKQEVELKEELSRLKSERITKESLISRLELDISDKADEISQLQSQLRKVGK